MELPPVSAGDVIRHLREHQITLIWNQAEGTLQEGTAQAIKIAIRKAS